MTATKTRLPATAFAALATAYLSIATLTAATLTSSAWAADAGAGRQKAKKCQTCHGIDGIAKIPIAPHIAGESQIYLETQLKAFRSGKREHEIMSVIAKDLSDADIADLSAWYASIKITATMPE
jgi:cytochrome c553